MDYRRSRTQYAPRPHLDAAFAETLESIAGSLDWSVFNRFFLWLEKSNDLNGHRPLVLFRSMLLQHFYALSAPEFDLDLKDRISFRKFAGLGQDEVAPEHSDLSRFRRLLDERNLTEEVFTEFQQLIDKCELPDLKRQGMADGLDQSLTASTDIWSKGPPEWISLRESFLSYWDSKRSSGEIPNTDEIKLSEAEHIRQNMTLIRVLPDDEGFRYEWVGENLRNANENDNTGDTIAEKAEDNIRKHGHAGLHGELDSLFSSVTARRRPVSTSTYFINAGGRRCTLWTVQAPLLGDNESIDMLLGIAMVNLVEII